MNDSPTLQDAPTTQDTPMPLDSSLIHLGPLQLRVMHAVWRTRADTVQQVADHLNSEPHMPRLAYTTYLTVMRNLVRRGMLTQTKNSSGRAHTFRPRIDEEQYKTAFLQYILKEYCQGDVALLQRYAIGEGRSGDAG